MSATPDELSLRVLTVNTHKGFTFFNRRFILPELREAIRTVGADIVFLQEVLGVHQGHAGRHHNWPDEPQYEFLADTVWPQFAYGQNAVYPDGHHGNALLSKYPITHHENRDVSIAGPERRGLLYCTLQIPHYEQPLHAVCVHLGLQEGHRHRQLGLLCELIDSLPAHEPLVIAGDFNDWRVRANDILGRCSGVHEVFVTARGQAARTFPARFPLLALDRIYVRNVALHEPFVLSNRPWSHLSDHAPLAAEIGLRMKRSVSEQQAEVMRR